jgi:hypothetical protein
MDYADEERTPQAAAEGRRSLGIKKAVSDARTIKFDRPRVFDFRTSGIVQMERVLHTKSWQIVQEFSVGGWSHEELMGILWTGLLHSDPNITINDAWAIWDATPIEERTNAAIALVKTLTRALGAGEETRPTTDTEE